MLICAPSMRSASPSWSKTFSSRAAFEAINTDWVKRKPKSETLLLLLVFVPLTLISAARASLPGDRNLMV
eukprot:m.238605 g.238605  ORF g.238605 m.238605 type:complete len:70 (+) comp21874_c0_seq1:416-625(+)